MLTEAEPATESRTWAKGSDDENTELKQLINDKPNNSAAISDYAPNGLQVEGKETVQKNRYRRDRKSGAARRSGAFGTMCGYCSSWLLLERRVSGYSRYENAVA